MFNNIIPVEVLLEHAKSTGAYYQLPLLETPPELIIEEAYLVGVPVKTNMITTSGKQYSTLSEVDHPTFAANRDWLAINGYIHKETGWCNGDRVLKEFKLNSVNFSVHDSFPCAGAMKSHLKYKIED